MKIKRKSIKTSRNRFYFYIIGVLLLFFLISGVINSISGQKNVSPQESNPADFSFLNQEQEINIEKEEQVEEQNGKIVHPLTGLLVEKNQIGCPVSIVIDNFPASYPLSGLDKASFIYEVLVEGGITRYLAVFDSLFLPNKVGPVRSARPYFIFLAEQYKGVFAHAGGSPDALELIKKGVRFYDLDEISQGDYFWRDDSRNPPYNLYTSSKLIREFIKENKITDCFSDFIPFSYSSNEEYWPYHGQEVNVYFSSKKKTTWEYIDSDQVYWDKQAGIKVKNLVVLKTRMEVVDDIGRLFVDLNSGGDALFFKQGKTSLGEWEKQGNRIYFYDKDNNEISLIPGTTWVGIVSVDDLVTY